MLHVSPSRSSELVRFLMNGPGTSVGAGAGDILCWIGGGGGFHYDDDHEFNTVSKNPPPREC